jgi:hypothetical protein
MQEAFTRDDCAAIWIRWTKSVSAAAALSGDELLVSPLPQTHTST